MSQKACHKKHITKNMPQKICQKNMLQKMSDSNLDKFRRKVKSSARYCDRCRAVIDPRQKVVFCRFVCTTKLRQTMAFLAFKSGG